MYDAQNLSPLQAFLRSKWVRVVLVVDVLLVLLLIGVAIFQNTKTATVDILTVPSVAKVKIGGGDYESGVYRIHPGDYEATVYADGFVTKMMPVEARAGEISKVWVYLVPEEGNLNYYAQHVDDWYNMGLMSDEEAQRVYKVLSIQEELPMDYVEQNETEYEGAVVASKYIVIDKSNVSCEAYYCLRIATIFNKSEDTVRAILAEKSFNMDDYDIEWKVYTGETMGGDALNEMREGEWGY
ncbi:hypothetical protein IKG64_02755 [Candidatus Saccharibacteria bacterium]|nr:hypothetical protein [Candidatus Saccharibacteria bacterium]